MTGCMGKAVLLAWLCLAVSTSAAHAADVAISIGYLRHETVPPPVLSNLDPLPADLGIAGARLAIEDNRTTGLFLGHTYALDLVSVPPEGDFIAAAQSLLAKVRVVLVDAAPGEMTELADLPEARDALLFNVASGEAGLRQEGCRANLLHTVPEGAMLTDALMEVLKAHHWENLALLTGPTAEDAAYATLLKASAAKFGLIIEAEKAWATTADIRLSATEEVPRLTQDLPEHQVLVVADARDDFARYVEHNTWLPRPVAGGSGLVAKGWSAELEQWGAAQLQSRFARQAARKMRPRDYAAWVAVRAAGEAVTRTGKADAPDIRSFLLSDTFNLDGFLGVPLSFRGWNGQLRQPIPVGNARAVVETAPAEGFLHAVNPLDSLGFDEPESRCTAFNRE